MVEGRGEGEIKARREGGEGRFAYLLHLSKYIRVGTGYFTFVVSKIVYPQICIQTIQATLIHQRFNARH